MLNLGCFGKERKKKIKRGTRSAGGQNGLLPVLSPLSRQRKSVAIEFLGPTSRQGGATERTSVLDRSVVHAAAHTTSALRATERAPTGETEEFPRDREISIATNLSRLSVAKEISQLRQSARSHVATKFHVSR